MSFLRGTLYPLSVALISSQLAFSNAAYSEEKGNSIAISKTLSPGKAHEECLELQPPQQMVYTFKASSPLDFNIHYHVKSDVFYPVKQDSTRSQKSVFKPSSKQEYCMMWENKSSTTTSIDYEYLVK